MRGLLATIIAIFAGGMLTAQEVTTVVVGADTLEYVYTPIDQTPHAQKSVEGFGLRLNNYLTLQEDDPRRVKVAVIGAPAYSANTGWRLSAMAVMNYRTPRVGVPHSLTLSAMASLKGCYTVALDGKNYLGHGRHQLGYGVKFDVARRYIYGLDYDASLRAQRGEYGVRGYGAYMRYSYRLFDNLTIGVSAEYDNIRVLHKDEYAVEVLDNQISHFWGVGIGVNATCSTRRVEDINLVRGVHICAEYGVHPGVLNSGDSSLHEVSVTVDFYQPLWRGGLLALDVYGEHHSANTPWMLRAGVGDESRMRGYYAWRFNGNTMVALQLELRQRVWEGLVVAGWGGCGTAFSPHDPVAWRKVLPTYGAGVRWYFNPSSLVRIDCGFGRDGWAFVVGYNEAF